MTGGPRLWRLTWSLACWWLLIALVLWLLGKALDQPASIAQCTASSAFLVAVGEAGDWLRRRWTAKQAAKRHLTAPTRHRPPDTETPTDPS
ncbi:hypothetical protein [Streptomyces sp. N50]|uniref:hypothetical protein n=1 Tax=Streptomyces sp. N50 TaxID=3081765 RepID=UPI00296243C8|nr:hypothetical protein [Streptomyces sp. N50]WOX13623.1 hypothetical protein R2B38_34480 [Streptomyces sp. N50]